MRALSYQNSTQKFTKVYGNLSLLSFLKQEGATVAGVQVSKQPIRALGVQNCREWVGMIPVNGGPPVSKPSQSQGGLSSSPRENGIHLDMSGGTLPHSIFHINPFTTRPSPRCTISHPPTPYLSRACPSSQVLEFWTLSPLAVPRAPPPTPRQTFYYY